MRPGDVVLTTMVPRPLIQCVNALSLLGNSLRAIPWNTDELRPVMIAGEITLHSSITGKDDMNLIQKKRSMLELVVMTRAEKCS